MTFRRISTFGVVLLMAGILGYDLTEGLLSMIGCTGFRPLIRVIAGVAGALS